MKYIVEIKPEYEDSFKGLMILGAKDSNLFVDVLAVDDLELLNSDYINEHFGDLQDTAYQKGLEDGKAQSEKGCEGCRYENRTSEENPCVDCSKNFKNHWRAKQTDEIKVGDEVVNMQTSCKFVVTHLWENNFGEKGASGFSWECSALSTKLELLKKTGRHFNIDKILEEMKG